MADAPVPAPLPAPALERIGKYEVRGVLGRGAMGVVYDGWDPMIERRVAIKTARLPDPDDVEAQEEMGRFRREAQAAGRLSHPNIVGVYDSGEIDDPRTGGAAFFVMELVEGQTLRDMLQREQRMAPGDVVAIMEEVLSGLNYSHKRGVIHRDIKPANIMVTHSGQAKIADFGIARIESSSMTQAGTMMGTPAYMSPEQFMGQAVDSRTDIYSAGVLLYQLLTGERPFEGSITAIMHKALNTTPPAPSALSVTVKPALDAVVARAMAKRPEDRYATAAEFSAALRAAYEAPEPEPVKAPEPVDDDATMIAPSIRPAPVAAATAPPARPRSKAPLLIAGAAALLALAGGGAWFALSGGPAPKPPTKVADVVEEPPKPVQLPDPPPGQRPPDRLAGTDQPPATREPEPQQVAAILPPLRQPAVAATDPAVLRAAMSNALRDVACSVSEVAAGPDGAPLVSSVVGAAQTDAVRRAAAAASPGAAPNVQVRSVIGRYCRVLDVVRGMSDGLPMSLGLKGGLATLRDGDVIAPSLNLPDAPSYMRLDYFSNDGTVSHLYPSPADVELAFGPRASWQPKAGKDAAGKDLPAWQVGPPFGTDLIVAVASSSALLTVHRPPVEPIDAYVQALQFAADALRKRGGKLSGRVVVLDTAQ